MSHKSCFVALAGLVVLLSACARGLAAPFVNLDFEQSTVQPSDPFVVTTAAAFPGWTARFGASTSANVYHDYEGAGEPIVAVYDKGVVGPGFVLLQGKYMAYLAPGSSNTPTSLSQIGDIPSDAKSMTLLCDGSIGGAGPPIVMINGSIIHMIHLAGIDGGGFINTYGTDVTTFAGTTVELTFADGPSQEFQSGRRVVDDVRFSSTTIPEPLSFLGLLMFVPISAMLRPNRRDAYSRRSSRYVERKHPSSLLD